LTHGHTLPGEQKDRNYNWYVDKHNHVFGKGEQMEQDGAKKSLRTDLLFSEYPITNVGQKRLEDYRQATSDLLGKGKFKGTLNPNIPNGFSFGVKSMKEGTWNVGKCLTGDMDSKRADMVVPDIDLGKSVNYRAKNTKLHPQHVDDNSTSNRLFGVPTVRSDLPSKEKKSVSDLTVSKLNIINISYEI
jgi:hypothetical protein